MSTTTIIMITGGGFILVLLSLLTVALLCKRVMTLVQRQNEAFESLNLREALLNALAKTMCEQTMGPLMQITATLPESIEQASRTAAGLAAIQEEVSAHIQELSAGHQTLLEADRTTRALEQEREQLESERQGLVAEQEKCTRLKGELEARAKELHEQEVERGLVIERFQMLEFE
jgi:chromosome segregation ATPase